MASELTLSYEEPTRQEQLEAIYAELATLPGRDRDFQLYDKAKSILAWLPEPEQRHEADRLERALFKEYGFTKSQIIKDIEATARSLKKSGRLSVEDKATKLYEFILPDLESYRDRLTGETYVRIDTLGVGQPSPWLSTDSATFTAYLNNTAHREFGWIGRSEVFRTVILKLNGDAATDISLSRLIARYDGNRAGSCGEEGIVYDLATAKGEVVQVTPRSWSVVVEDAPVFKRRDIGTPPQVRPDGDIGDIKLLSDLLTFRDKTDEVLSIPWIVSTVIPGLARPILNLHGTYAGRRARTISQLIEPSVFDPVKEYEQIAVYSQPKNVEQAEHQISHRHLIVYDTRHVSEWFAGTLSSTFYGTRTQKRKLRTDNDSYVLYLSGPVVLSSLHRLGLHYTDLQDKLMPVRCDEPTSVLPEAEYWKAYRDEAPSILGGIFSTLSEAIPRVSGIEITNPDPLLGDFQKWGAAIADVLGYSSEAFLEAFNENRDTVAYEVIEADPLAHCVLAILPTGSTWDGTPRELWNELRKVAIPLRIDTNDPLFPQSPEQVTKRLNELRVDLNRLGISYTWKGLEKIKTPATKSGYTTRKIISLRR